MVIKTNYITIKRGRCGGDSLDSGAALQEFKLPEALLQAFAASAQRLVDGLGRRSEPPLENSERESDRPRSLIVGELFGAVKLLAHIIGDFAVESEPRPSGISLQCDFSAGCLS